MDEFEKIYREYFTDVWRYLLKLTHDESLAEEITAETFFRALNAIDSFRKESSVRVWLCSIARNVYYDRLKKEKRSVELSDTGMLRIPDPGRSPEEELLLKEEYRQLLETADKLNEPYRSVLRMRAIEERSYREIAAHFKKSVNWVSVVYHRAKEMIRKEYGNYEE